jgi:hypothetical protein
MASTNYSRTDIATRAFIVALKSLFGGKSSTKITKKLSISKRTIDLIYGRVVIRGFKPNQDTLVIRDK